MIVGVLLAAGDGRRFGGDKLLAELGAGQCIAERACAHLRPAVDRLIAVVRTGDKALATRLHAAGAEIAFFDNAHLGIGASLAFGVSSAPEADGWLIALADMPLVTDACARQVASALCAGASIAVPLASGRRGHPVGFSRQFGAELTVLDSDIGASTLLRKYKTSIKEIPVTEESQWLDIDTREDLESVRLLFEKDR